MRLRKGWNVQVYSDMSMDFTEEEYIFLCNSKWGRNYLIHRPKSRIFMLVPKGR